MIHEALPTAHLYISRDGELLPGTGLRRSQVLCGFHPFLEKNIKKMLLGEWFYIKLSHSPGNPEEEQWVKDILTGMGYTVDARTFCCAPADCLPAVRKDVAEIGAEAFMAAVPAGTGIRQRAVFSRFLKALQEEKDENLGAPGENLEENDNNSRNIFCDF